VPKSLAIEDDMPRRRRSRSKRAAVDVDVERNLLMRVLLHSPKDTLAGCVAAAGVVAIIANATFLQAGRHPAPMFNTPFPVTGSASPVSAPTIVSPNPLPRPRPVDAEAKPVELKSAESAVPTAPKSMPAQGATSASPASIAARSPASIAASTHGDPVGDLITSTRRVAAVQRALTDFGYGQLKSTGVAGTDTQAAIQKFERERKLPVTGQISERLVHELNAVTGRTID
jgi:hypothetical protein